MIGESSTAAVDLHIMATIPLISIADQELWHPEVSTKCVHSSLESEVAQRTNTVTFYAEHGFNYKRIG